MTENPAALLRWYADSGIDTVEWAEPEGLTGWTVKPPTLSFAPSPMAPASRSSSPPSAPSPSATVAPAGDAPLPTDEAVAMARQAAAAATTHDALVAAIQDFDGCPLKPGARSTVVCDGVQRAPLLILGEAPGRQEDRVGKPFAGPAGQLLDLMLDAIGFSRTANDDREDALITNAIYWRPPGNRTPTKAEIAICQPFVARFIELNTPKVIVLAGNVPTQALIPGAPGITRSRGTWREWSMPNGGPSIPVLPIFHPAFLLRQPVQKRLAWHDLKLIRQRLPATS